MNLLQRLTRENAREIRFFFGFIVLFILLQTLQYFTLSYTTPFLVDTMTIRTSSAIINTITPVEKTIVREGVITGGATVVVMRGCEGVEGMLLLIAAICAFPARILFRIYGIIGGILIIYVFNLSRIVGLYYINRYRPDLFDMMHIYVGQTVIIIITMIFFIFWMSQIDKNSQSNP